MMDRAQILFDRITAIRYISTSAQFTNFVAHLSGVLSGVLSWTFFVVRVCQHPCWYDGFVEFVKSFHFWIVCP